MLQDFFACWWSAEKHQVSTEGEDEGAASEMCCFFTYWMPVVLIGGCLRFMFFYLSKQVNDDSQPRTFPVCMVNECY